MSSLQKRLKNLHPKVILVIILFAVGAIVVLASQQTAVAQGSCGDGSCGPGESVPTCPQDCGALLVDENFEDGLAQGWNYNPAHWQIVNGGGSQVWNNGQADAFASTGSTAWGDIAWFLRVRRIAGDANLYFRADWGNNNSYGLRVESSQVALWTERSGGPVDLASSGSVPIGTDWHNYRIDAVQRQITVTIDSAVVLTYSDGVEASLRGGIGLESFAANGVHFDDIKLYSLAPQCYNGSRDGAETGIDCGGSCPNQDCCANRAWDVGESGVDCGGSCLLTCQPAERLDRWSQTNGPWLEYVRRIRFDPDDADTLIISSNTGSGVAKSSDAGQSWHEISAGISPMNVFGLAMDPTDKNTLYAGTANGRLYKTSNGGDSWDLLWQYTGADDALWSLEVDPTNGDRIFAGMGDYTGCDGRVYRSEDGGQNWQKVLDVDPSDNLDAGFISHIAIDPTNAITMYATTGLGDWCGGGSPGDPDGFSYGIWKSTNGGDSWTAINNGLEDLTVSHVVIDPSNPATLYAGVGCVDDDIELAGNVFKSTDGGANWQRLDVSPGTPITRLALHPDDPQKIYAMGYGGVFFSEDGGATWERIHETFKSAIYSFVYDIAFAPDNPNTMYIGTYSGGIIKSIDGGRNWFEIDGLRHNGDVLANSYGTALDTASPDTMYATTIGGIFKTTNGGEVWNFIGDGLFAHLRQIAIDPTNPNRLYLGGDSQNFYTSDDAGESWDQIDLAGVDLGDDPQFPIIAVDPHSPNRLVAGLSGSGDVLMRSDSYGQSWTGQAPLGLDGEVHAFAFHPTQPGAVVAGLGWSPDQPYLIRSEDGGQSWVDHAPGLNLLTVYQLKELNGRLYAATNGSGVQLGWGGGSGVWESLSYVEPAHRLAYVTRLAAASGSPEKLLAFDKSDLTLYRHTDPTEPLTSWQSVMHLTNTGDDIYDVTFDPHNPAWAYATTRHGGFWRSSDAGLTWAQANTGLPADKTWRGLAADQSTSGKIFVGQLGAPGRIYASSNRGNSWALLNSELTFSTIHAFAVDPSDPDVAYAGVWGGGTWKTEDGGASWLLLPNAPASAAALVVDPANPQIIYATDRTEPTLWQSADGGEHWWRRFNAGPEYSRLLALAVDPHQEDTVYVSAFKHGGYGSEGDLFRITSATAGKVSNGLPRTVISLTISPSQPGLMLASTHIYGLYRSTNHGASWQLAAGGLPNVGFNAMAWQPTSGALYAGASSSSFPDYMRPPGLPNGDDEPGIYRSMDAGLTWDKVLAGVTGKEIAFSAGAIYAATDAGLYVSTNNGNDWGIQAGGPALAYSTVAVDNGQLYVGSLGGGVHTAAINPDLSVNWQGTNGPYAQIHAIELLSAPGQPNTLFATAFPGGVFKSTDGGTSWGEANFGLPGFSLPDPDRNGYYTLAVNPANPNNLFLGIYGYGVYRSDDGGGTWLVANMGLGNRYVYSLMVEQDGSHVWVGTNDGRQSLWRSATDTPGRLAWSPAPTSPASPHVVSDMAINPQNPAEMSIAAFPAGIFSTTDGGQHWYERTNNLYLGNMRTHGTGFEDGYYQLVLDPVDPQHLIFGTYTAQIYQTFDGGQSWISFDEGVMREGSIYDFEVAADGSRLYVSQKAGGVLRRAMDGDHSQRRVISGGSTPCTSGSHTYSTVGEALSASHPGDRLVVCPGQYHETVTVDGAVRLESFGGPAQTFLEAATVTGDNACVAGFRLDWLEVEGASEVELLGNVIGSDDPGGDVFLPVILKSSNW